MRGAVKDQNWFAEPHADNTLAAPCPLAVDCQDRQLSCILLSGRQSWRLVRGRETQ